MHTHFEPYILEDLSELPEIYRFRVFCYEHSPGKEDINFQKYPNGFSDKLDERSIHVVAKDEAGHLVGTARMTICSSLDELPYSGVFKAYAHLIPTASPFLYYSRLVVHPLHRKSTLRMGFDSFRVEYMNSQNIFFAIANAKPKRSSQLKDFGFKQIGIASKSVEITYPFSDHVIMILLNRSHRHTL